MANDKVDAAYLHTVDRLEPAIHPIDAGAGWASVAISLKRIADSLERLEKVTTPQGIIDLLEGVKKLAPDLMD
jgi:hypothetical protein